MRKRIAYSIWIISLIGLIAALLIIMPSLYSHFTQEQYSQLRNEAKLAAQGVKQGGLSYLLQLEPADFRITWIMADGTIIYDNAVDSSGMENHLGRAEIRSALEGGSGEAIRYSSTLASRQLYAARLLDDGSVLRFSITQATIWHLFLRFSLPILIVAGAALLFSFVLAERLAQRIVRPINHLNLDHPLENDDDEIYSEVRPLLMRIENQHAQIEADREKLERASLVRQEFTANASHELKTPLHVISGYAELIESGMIPREDVKQFSGKIRREAQRMSKLVDDIINLSNLDSGATGIRREKTDLCRIAKNTVDSLVNTAQEAGVKLLFHGEKAELDGVPQVLYSLVYNLCLNAIKYSDKGGEVDVDVYNENGKVILRVEDHGVGISADDQIRIFERFYRVDKSRSKEVGGTGLGLSIVKHAASIHGADISVSSSPGVGSVFTVTFPSYKEFTEKGLPV